MAYLAINQLQVAYFDFGGILSGSHLQTNFSSTIFGIKSQIPVTKSFRIRIVFVFH